MSTIKRMCNVVFAGRFPSRSDPTIIPYRVVFDRRSYPSRLLPCPAPSLLQSESCLWRRLAVQCSASWWRTALHWGDLSKICSGSDVIVRRAVFFFPPSEPWTRFTATSQSRVSPQWRLCSLRLLGTVSDVGAEMWDAAWRDWLIEAKLWHGYPLRKRSRN